MPAMDKSKSAHNLLALLISFSLLFAIVCLGISFLSFGFLKPVIDSLAPDGQVESLTQSSLSIALIAIRVIGGFCAFVALGLLILRSKFLPGLAKLLEMISWKNLTKDFRKIFAISPGEHVDRIYLVALLVITLLALLIRLIFISKPMSHDEAYTFLAFASRSFRVVISDYHLPNNHVFHTILVYLAYHLFGNQPWIIRLPALVAGVLVVPATYWVGCLFYDRNTAILSAALVASASPLISYSTSARGYSLLGLFTLLILGLGVLVKDNKNLLAWILIVVLSSLGFYTNPTMLYPFGILMTWLLVSALLKDVAAEYNSIFFYYLLLSGISVVFITILLYTPIITFSGLNNLIGNSVIASLNWEDFQQSIWVRAQNTWEDWTEGVPILIITLLVIGIIISLIFHRKLSAHRFPLQIAAVIWIAVALIIQKVAPWPRIWLFLLPLFIIWGTSGLIYLLSLVISQKPFSEKGYPVILGLAIFVPAFLLTTYSINPPYPAQIIGPEEEITRYLKDYLQPGDVVVATSPTRAQVGYYFSAYGISEDFFYTQGSKFNRAIVLVNEKQGEPLESVIQHTGLSDQLDSHLANPIRQFRYAIVYEISR